MPGMLMASWAPSVQNRLGPAIDISSWNTEADDRLTMTMVMVMMMITWTTAEMAGK